MSSFSADQRAIIAIIVSFGLFNAGDGAAKTVAQLYPAGEVLVLRSGMILLCLTSLLVASGQIRQFGQLLRGPVLLRAGFDGITSPVYLVVLVHLPLATLGAIVMTVPLMITVLSAALFGEQVGWRRWTAIAIGFLGALIVIRPTPSEFNIWALVAFAGAFITASRDLTTTRVDPSTPAFLVALAGTIATMIAGALMGLTEQWRLFTQWDFLLLATAAILHCLGGIFLVIASRNKNVSVVAPFRYSFLIWATLVGYLVFREIPDRWFWIGAALIVGSGLYALHREKLRGQKTPATLPDPL